MPGYRPGHDHGDSRDLAGRGGVPAAGPGLARSPAGAHPVRQPRPAGGVPRCAARRGVRRGACGGRRDHRPGGSADGRGAGRTAGRAAAAGGWRPAGVRDLHVWVDRRAEGRRGHPPGAGELPVVAAVPAGLGHPGRPLPAGAVAGGRRGHDASGSRAGRRRGTAHPARPPGQRPAHRRGIPGRAVHRLSEGSALASGRAGRWGWPGRRTAAPVADRGRGSLRTGLGSRAGRRRGPGRHGGAPPLRPDRGHHRGHHRPGRRRPGGRARWHPGGQHPDLRAGSLPQPGTSWGDRRTVHRRSAAGPWVPAPAG